MPAIAPPKVKLGTTDLESETIQKVVVDQGLNKAAMCEVQLKNTTLGGGATPLSSSTQLGDPIIVKIGFGNSPEVIFNGEVVGIEPVYDMDGKSFVRIRAFDKLHRLTRSKKSRTFANQSPQAIVRTIAQEYGLTLEADSDTISREHRHQFGQSDHDFLTSQTAREPFIFRVKGEKTLIFKKRDLQTDSGLVLKMGKFREDSAGGEGEDQISLQRFAARMSAGAQVGSVEVRGLDPNTRETIVGRADGATTSLGDTSGNTEGTDSFGDHTHVESDDRVTSQEEADARAAAIMEDRALDFLIADGMCMGHPKMEPGIVVTIDLGPDTRFSGKYYIDQATHRYSTGGASDAGYKTTFRARRNARGE